jgi:hypothetical protein
VDLLVESKATIRVEAPTEVALTTKADTTIRIATRTRTIQTTRSSGDRYWFYIIFRATTRTETVSQFVSTTRSKSAIVFIHQ